MKKITAIALALFLVLTLCACGGSKDGTSPAGTYQLYAMDYDEKNVVLASEMFEGENYLTLKDGGSAELCLESEKVQLGWKADGSKLHFTSPDGDLDGTLSGGILTLDVDGQNLYFAAPGASTDKLKAVTLDELIHGVVEDPGLIETPEATEPAATEPAPTEPAPTEPKETALMRQWNGWYYGCADINGSEGGWEFANGMTFDSAMYVELGPDGTGMLGIFDPYGEMAQGPNNNRFITIQCHADERYLYGDSGTEFGYEINPSNWVFVHNLDNPKKLNVGSSYTDEDGNKMGYDFTFLPWGDRWEGEAYTQFIPHFEEYLARLDEGWLDPFGYLEDPLGTGKTPAGPDTPTEPSTGGLSPLLGSNPTKLDVNDRGVVYVYYPADQFTYDDWYGKLKNEAAGVGILMDPMLGATNLQELRDSYMEHNSDEEDFSLVDTEICGCKALILKYSDWLGSTMRVDLDFGGNHDGWYGISFVVTGDSLADCDTDLIWAIIQSMELAK